MQALGGTFSVSDQASQGAGDSDPSNSLPSTTEAPAEYRERDPDWFTPGRLFKIWALEDLEIHQKEFVLLDTKNIEGPGLRVRVYGEEEEQEAMTGYFFRSHVLVQNFKPFEERPERHRRLKTVFMDEYEHEQQVGDHTWIELEHTYNIPFLKYKCVDCGVLDRSSLQDLRRCYIEWLKYHWNLG